MQRLDDTGGEILTNLNIFARVFVEVSESLTNDERREMLSASITYEERVRDILVGSYDRRITKLREEHALWSSYQDTQRVSDHAAMDSEEKVPSPPDADIVPSEPDDNAPNPAEAEPSCGNARIEHISSCKGQREATFVIGGLNPNGISVGEAAALIHAAGLSKGRVDTVMSNIHNHMSNDEAWQKIGSSRFRLLPKIRAVDGLNPEQMQQEITEEGGSENELIQVA